MTSAPCIYAPHNTPSCHRKETDPDGYVRVYCKGCNKFLGYKAADKKGKAANQNHPEPVDERSQEEMFEQ